MHRLIRLHLLALLPAIALAGMLGCSPTAETEPGGERSDDGRIRELDPTQRTVVIRHRLPVTNTNEEVRVYRTYKVAHDCRISTADKQNAQFSDLRLDAKVDVRYVQDGDRFILYRIKPD